MSFEQRDLHPLINPRSASPTRPLVSHSANAEASLNKEGPEIRPSWQLERMRGAGFPAAMAWQGLELLGLTDV